MLPQRFNGARYSSFILGEILAFDWTEFKDVVSLNEALKRHVAECYETNTCPECSNSFEQGLGSGKITDGLFCSLSCFAEFRQKKTRIFNPPSRN